MPGKKQVVFAAPFAELSGKGIYKKLRNQVEEVQPHLGELFPAKLKEKLRQVLQQIIAEFFPEPLRNAPGPGQGRGVERHRRPART